MRRIVTKTAAFIMAGIAVSALPAEAAQSPSAVSHSVAVDTARQAEVSAITASAVPERIAEAAARENKTVGEYMNNAVTSTPGLEEALPLGQGGHVRINGAPSNQTFSVLKATRQNINSAKELASSLGGKVLNVAQITASISRFDTAEVNFYLKGVLAGQKIKVYQLVDGQWEEVTVLEIREDHVVVEMKSLGVLSFVELYEE